MIVKSAAALVAFAVLGAAGAQAQTATAPMIAPNDSWTYATTSEVGGNFRQVRDEMTVDHVSAGAIAVTERTLDSNTPARQVLMNADWSRTRSVNGHQTMVNQPLDFPLRVGKSWIIEYTEDNPNRQHTSEHFRSPYKVTGWEDVTVPAGTFHALKVEVDGEWSAAIAPATMAAGGARVDRFGATGVTQATRIPASTASGRTYKAFWYVPEVKRWVKSVEEYYSSNGQRTASYRSELASYKAGG